MPDYSSVCLGASISANNNHSHHPVVVLEILLQLILSQKDRFSPFLHILNKNRTQFCFKIRTIKGNTDIKKPIILLI